MRKIFFDTEFTGLHQNTTLISIGLVSDVCHYDMVLLCELIADGAMLLPEYINPFCHDLYQDISMILDISEKAAFDISREQLLTDRGIDLPKGQKHNVLYDAEVIKAIHEDYQEVCIKNSKLNATVDVLVEKISMLKAVGCHG